MLTVTNEDVLPAYLQRVSDFEDCLLATCTKANQCDAIVTRNEIEERPTILPSVKETFEQIWPDAVKKALEILFKQNRTEKMSMAQYQIYVSKLWSEICQKVGYMNIVDYDNFGDIKSIFYDLEKRHLIKKENDGIE